MRFPIGFSSMGDPDLDLSSLHQLAAEFEMDFLELRCLKGSLDLPQVFARHPPPAGPSKARVVASSFHLADIQPADLGGFEAFARLADSLQAPYLRVFGSERGPVTPNVLEAAARGVGHLRGVIREGGFQCRLLLETHGVFSSARSCAELNGMLDTPLDILWDSHHTWKLAGESLPESWRLLSPHVVQIHYKDSIATDNGHRYVPPGRGQFPTAELLKILTDADFRGGLCLEWEKLWHPEIAPLREALEGFRIVLAGGRQAT